MSINMPQGRVSPIERTVELLQGVSLGKDIYDKFKNSSKAADQEETYSDPTSAESKQARDLISKVSGSPIAETVSRKQIESQYGPIAQLANEDFKFSRQHQNAIDLEKLKNRGEIDKARLMAGMRKPADRLPADKVLTVNQGNTIPKQLADISATIGQNADSFGPVMGRLSTLNPYDTKSQTIDAQLRASAQAFGRYMEGGVLRKEDEDKYRKMFPTLGDTPEVARNKLAIVNKLLVEKQKSDVGALEQQGYSVNGLQADLGKGEIPGIIRTKAGGGSGGLVPNAQAAPAQGPHGAAVVQNGVVFQWNPQTNTYEPL